MPKHRLNLQKIFREIVSELQFRCDLFEPIEPLLDDNTINLVIDRKPGRHFLQFLD